MAWLPEITWIVVHKSENVSISVRSRQRPATLLEEWHYRVDGVEQTGTYEVTVPIEIEQRGTVTTTVTTTISESNALSRETALAGVTSSSTSNALTGNSTVTSITAEVMNRADGWKLTKTVVETAISYGTWYDYTES